MTTEYVQKGSEVECRFHGRLDTLACNTVVPEIMDKIATAKTVVFNLEGVDYVATVFLRLCSQVLGKVSRENFSIVNANPNILKVFKIAGLDKFLSIR